MNKVQARKEKLAKELSRVQLPTGKESVFCWTVGSELQISGVSVKNYLNGKIGDGYLGEEILTAFKKMNMVSAK